MRIVCWQTILMKYHTLFFFKKYRKMSQNLSSAAVVIGTLRVKYSCAAWNIDLILFCLFGFDILRPGQQLWSY